MRLPGMEKGGRVGSRARKNAAVCLWLALALPALRAQDEKVPDLTGLSLEDLAQVRLYTASRHLDDPRKAPSVVTVVFQVPGLAALV